MNGRWQLSNMYLGIYFHIATEFMIFNKSFVSRELQEPIRVSFQQLAVPLFAGKGMNKGVTLLHDLKEMVTQSLSFVEQVRFRLTRNRNCQISVDLQSMHHRILTSLDGPCPEIHTVARHMFRTTYLKSEQICLSKTSYILERREYMYIIMCNYVTYQSMATRKYHYVLVRQSHPVKDISKM